MIRHTARSTHTDTPFPYTTLFRDVLTFFRKSAGNDIASGAQQLATPFYLKAPGLDHRDTSCARQILCRGDARLVGQGDEEIVLDLEMNMARGRVLGEVEHREHLVVDRRDQMIAPLHIERDAGPTLDVVPELRFADRHRDRKSTRLNSSH